MLLNLIPAERLEYIPADNRSQHEFCFRLHDMMADALRQAERERISEVTIRFKDEAEALQFRRAKNVFQFLEEAGRAEDLRQIVVNHVAIPLYADMLHFIYEALICLERRKTTVAFALLRKPLKYSLTVASALFADKDDFYDRLAASPSAGFDERRTTAEDRRALLSNAIKGLGQISNWLDADTIYSIVYDRSESAGLAGYFDLATHLITGYKSIETQPLNLNFIFKNPSDDDLYQRIYYPLAYVLIYLYFLQLKTYGRMALISDTFVTWAQIATIGTFEAVFGVAKGKPIQDWANESFHEFLRCVTCASEMQVTSGNAGRLFMAEEIQCEHCGSAQQFPLWWLVAHSEVVASGPTPTAGAEGS